MGYDGGWRRGRLSPPPEREVRVSEGRVNPILLVVACLALMAVAAAMPAAPEVSDGELERQPTWAMPTTAQVGARMLAWLDAAAVANPAAADAITALRPAWADDAAVDPRGDLLDRIVDAFARVDPRVAAVQRGPGAGGLAAGLEWLDDPSVDPFQRDAVRLWLGRECVRRDRFDDGLALLEGLDVAASVDPATLLFHRAACQHWLLQADRALESLDRLLERSGEIPVRYERVARLLRADIAALEDESLDHIARRMRDITRRLDLGSPGPKTIAVQDGVIESLDKMIKSIEQQQQQQSQSSGGAGGSGRGGNGTPMDDSRIAGGKGPGEVTKRDIGDTDGWGKLPPHKREEALQQIGREFPAHYREAIEQYFKRLATGEEKR